MRFQSRLILTFALAQLLAGVALTGCGGHTMPTLPNAPAVVAGADQDIKAGAIKALGIIQAAGELAKEAQAVELQLSADGVVPAATHAQIQAGFRDVSKTALGAIDRIESGAVVSWPQLKGIIDPIIQKVQAVSGIVNAIGNGANGLKGWLRKMVDVLLDAVGPALGEAMFGGSR